MTRLAEFEVHDYMDMYPRKEVRAFKGEDFITLAEQAVRWANEMNKAYSGGTTTFKTVYTQMEGIQYISKMIAKTLEKPCVTKTDGGLDKMDVDYLKNIVPILEELVKE